MTETAAAEQLSRCAVMTIMQPRPNPTPPRRPAYSKPRLNTVEQLRDRIDRGHMRDKVKAFDPAAAPIGTDEEAAGTPTTAAAISDTLTRQRARADALTAASDRVLPLVVLVGVIAVALILIGIAGP
jgi:hypothetical protein